MNSNYVTDDATYITGIYDRQMFGKAKGALSDFGIFVYTTEEINRIPQNIVSRQGKVEIVICGTSLPQLDGVPIKFYGVWRYQNKYGWRFEANAYEVLEPRSNTGLVKFLSSPLFPGVGVKSAKQVVEEFGNETLDIIEQNDVKLVNRFGIDLAGKLVHYYKMVRYYGQLVGFLAKYGVSASTTKRISDLYGREAEKRIRNNPYCLMDVRGIGFATCDRIARGLGVALDSYVRIEGGILETLKRLCDMNGHMYCDKDILYRHTMDLLNGGFSVNVVDDHRYVEVIKEMVDTQKIVIRFGKDVYLKAYDDAEYNTAQRLLGVSSNPIYKTALRNLDGILDSYCKDADIDLDPVQKEAVIRSITNRVSIITGGPGTGKTTIISAIIACYEELFNGDVILMAPTGKAARRMSEATGREASTIHSRLRIYNGDEASEMTFTRSLIIVDETSMVDGLLMEKLMLAIESDDCHLIFCGDIDQLPSIGVGAVLGEMISSGVIPTSRLTKIFRQKYSGATIVENAAKVNCGDVALEYDDSFRFVSARSEEEAAAIIEKLYRQEIDTWGIENVALLCPLRVQKQRFVCASDAMNERLSKLINPPADNKTSVSLFKNTKHYRVGDRVMSWKNTQTASNGDIGEITAITKKDWDVEVTINWETGLQSKLNTEDMKHITHAYAMSIHKSQGSEYQCVIIPVLSSQKSDLFKRNLLYTGITRAKQRVILVGDEQGIHTMIHNNDSAQRNTHLADRLKVNCALFGL